MPLPQFLEHHDAGAPSLAPDFFTRPPPPGRSRESTITLDAEGVFHHDGERIEHPRLAEAMHRWIARHPLDGRLILNNGYDWTYFVVADAPYAVRALTEDADGFPVLVLSDGTTEPLGAQVRLGARDVLYAEVKRGAPGGPFEARFSRHAQSQLGPHLTSDPGQAEGDEVIAVRTRGGTVRLPL
ncbi:MAG: hypothetical protein IPF92_05370 [Myxococcales bacterium]|nr:hypothetical protein [Myxococcales bacterium]MBL0197998.1 hypothetical protein [Myxococcales bacterium]HQY60747.1 hypothetical protein [Polyangiaceae bacterium]